MGESHAATVCAKHAKEECKTQFSAPIVSASRPECGMGGTWPLPAM